MNDTCFSMVLFFQSPPTYCTSSLSKLNSAGTLDSDHTRTHSGILSDQLCRFYRGQILAILSYQRRWSKHQGRLNFNDPKDDVTKTTHTNIKLASHKVQRFIIGGRTITSSKLLPQFIFRIGSFIWGDKYMVVDHSMIHICVEQTHPLNSPCKGSFHSIK